MNMLVKTTEGYAGYSCNRMEQALEFRASLKEVYMI